MSDSVRFSLVGRTIVAATALAYCGAVFAVGGSAIGELAEGTGTFDRNSVSSPANTGDVVFKEDAISTAGSSARDHRPNTPGRAGQRGIVLAENHVVYRRTPPI